MHIGVVKTLEHGIDAFAIFFFFIIKERLLELEHRNKLAKNDLARDYLIHYKW